MKTRFEPGEVIGKCTIEAFIAEGGMGCVYRAHQPLLNRTVALKVLHPSYLSQPDTLGRFMREGKLAARLDHPSIVRVYDAMEEGDQYYLIMEYVEGRSLSEIVKQEGRMSTSDVLRVARQVAEALEYAHSQGIVHRDIKPGNILLTSDGQAKVTDFGIARSTETDSQLTRTGEIIGTPSYMSPEQCRGKTIDGRSDLYSLGATLYMVIAGHQPFKGTSGPALVHRIVHDRPPPLQSVAPDIRDDVLRLVQRLMAKHPGARYQTGKEVVAAVEEIGQARFRLARAPAPQSESSVGLPITLGGLAGAAVLVAAVCGLGYLLWSDSEEALARDSEKTAQIAEESRNDRQERSSRRVSRRSSRGQKSRSAPPRSTLIEDDNDVVEREQLESRINSFSRALVSGRKRFAMRFVAPDLRKRPAVQSYFTGVIEAMKTMSVTGKARHRLLPQGPEKAQVVLFFPVSGSGQSMAVPVEWVRVGDSWYVSPKTHGPQHSLRRH